MHQNEQRQAFHGNTGCELFPFNLVHELALLDRKHLIKFFAQHPDKIVASTIERLKGRVGKVIRILLLLLFCLFFGLKWRVKCRTLFQSAELHVPWENDVKYAVLKILLHDFHLSHFSVKDLIMFHIGDVPVKNASIVGICDLLWLSSFCLHVSPHSLTQKISNYIKKLFK